MSYYRVCDSCGASLDPGEICDCTKPTPMDKLREFSRNASARSNTKYCPICKEQCKEGGCAAWYQPKKLWSGDDEKPGYCVFLTPGV